MADLKSLTVNNIDVINEINNIKENYLPLTGGTITGSVTVTDSIKIGSAALAYDSTESALIISFE